MLRRYAVADALFAFTRRLGPAAHYSTLLAKKLNRKSSVCPFLNQ